MKVKMQTHPETKEIKNIILIVCFVMLASINGCGTDIVNRHESSDTDGIVENYDEMSDGTWKAGGITYKYRLELKGTMQNAAGESCFVVLTNNKDISFDEVAKSIFSSSSNDWLDRSQTIIVEMY